MTRLDTDPASATAKPGGAAPSKVSAPPPSTHDPRTGPWVRFWQDKPQHWGVPPAVKSAADLAGSNIDSTDPKLNAGPSAGVMKPVISSHEGQHAYQAFAQAAHMRSNVGSDSDLHQAEAVGFPVSSAVGAGILAAPSKAVRGDPWADSRQQHTAGSLASRPADVSDSADVSHSGSPASTKTAAAAAVGATAGARAVPKQKAAFNMYRPSKGTLQVLQKPPSKGPSPRKQIPLDQMLNKQAVAAQARALEAQHQHQQTEAVTRVDTAWLVKGDNGVDPSDEAIVNATDTADVSAAAAQSLPRVVLPQAGLAPGRSHHHSRLQGLALSQIDASVFAALPGEHQQELLQNLPKNTDRPAAGIAATEVNPAVASNFAFVTKLANLQKAGHVPTSKLPASSDSTAAEQAPKGLVNPETLKGDLSNLESGELEDPNSANSRSGAGSGSASPPSKGFAELQSRPDSGLLGSDTGAMHQTGSPSHAVGGSSCAEPAAMNCALPGCLSVGDSAQGRQASQAVRPEVHGLDSTSEAASRAALQEPEEAQQAQHVQVQQAEQRTQIQDYRAVSENTDQLNEGIDLDQGLEFDQQLDLDLMEEERTAMAGHGQPAAPDRLKNPTDAPQAYDASKVTQPGSNMYTEPEVQPHAVLDSLARQQQPQQQQPQQQQQQPGQHPSLERGVMPQRPVAALPPASQIDASVLDALPLQVRRELEVAYGQSSCNWLHPHACNRAVLFVILHMQLGIEHATALCPTQLVKFQDIHQMNNSMPASLNIGKKAAC